MSQRAAAKRQDQDPNTFFERRLKTIKRRAKALGIVVDVPDDDVVVVDELPDDAG